MAANKQANGLKRINLLIKDIQRDPFIGIGKPELLKLGLTGYWSRRIDKEHRIVYKVVDDELRISQLRYRHAEPTVHCSGESRTKYVSRHA